jgi:hypothetical protein
VILVNGDLWELVVGARLNVDRRFLLDGVFEAVQAEAQALHDEVFGKSEGRILTQEDQLVVRHVTVPGGSEKLLYIIWSQPGQLDPLAAFVVHLLDPLVIPSRVVLAVLGQSFDRLLSFSLLICLGLFISLRFCLPLLSNTIFLRLRRHLEVLNHRIVLWEVRKVLAVFEVLFE